MTRPWMPMYWGDYLGDTGHLSQAEHGAYVLLIAHYWQRGGLPDDEEKIRLISRSTPKQWPCMRRALAPFFHDGWRHRRIDRELAKSDLISTKRAIAGQKGGLASRGRGNFQRIAAAAFAGQTGAQPHKNKPSFLESAARVAAASTPEAVHVAQPKTPPPSPSAPHSAPDPSALGSAPDEDANVQARADVLERGIRMVMAETGCSELAARPMIQRWAGLSGFDYVRLAGLIDEGRRRAIGRAMDGWIVNRLGRVA
jgi:uncharacterized protein YdaU (DUF1376 family)